MRGYDIERLFEENAVPHETRNRRGWVSLNCPKCGGSYRLGWHQRRQLFFCWVCQRLPLVPTLAALLHKSVPETMRLLPKYESTIGDDNFIERPKGGAVVLKYPQYTGELLGAHKRYITSRGLDPDQVMAEFGEIYATPPHDPILPNRIVAPLYVDGEAVSWQARSILKGVGKLRYCTCAPDEEIIYHKSTVYGLDSVPGKTAVIVEGLFDVWKLGPGAVHTFGTAFLPAQVRVLASKFDRFFVMYDSKGEADPQGHAQKAGERLANAFACLGKTAVTVDPEDAKDPGAWSLEEARRIMRELLEDYQ